MDIETIANEMMLSKIISERDQMIISQHNELGRKDLEIQGLKNKIKELESKTIAE